MAYTGNILRVDLTTASIKTEVLEESIYRRYLGGSALASYFLLQELEPGIDPLGEKNILVFTCSILTGTMIPGASRFTVAAKSPLTGGFGESEAGGYWAPQFKKAGFDVLIITGRSPEPVYLWIHDGEAQLRDARHLWGKATKDVEEGIRQELNDEKIIVAQTGLAGENLVRYACIVNNLKHANGRTGMGAVMGSKHLRAVAVRGHREVPVQDPEVIKEAVKRFANSWRENPDNMGLYNHGTAGVVEPLNAAGILPTRNFVDGEFEGCHTISGETMTEKFLESRKGCYACPVRCKRVFKGKKQSIDPAYGGPEYETIGSLGSLCGIDDFESIAKGSMLCNQYGMDTISTGAAIAFAMECNEKGILKLEDTDLLNLRYGNAQAMLKTIDKIAHRQGLGDILAEGVKRAAEILGNGTEQYALHIKGQEIPLHDPRGKTGLGIGYAVSPTGADHQEATHDSYFGENNWVLEETHILGLTDPVDALDISAKKVRLFSYLQKLWSMYNSIGMCNFIAGPSFALPIDSLSHLILAITGWKTSLWTLMKVGEKANTMARCFNIREGFTKKDDILPTRFFEPLGNGLLEGKALNRDEFAEAVNLYYEMEGWDRNGIPTRGRLSELELDWINLNP